MFAVPGWSVSADSLKAEKVSAGGTKTASTSRKRKRAAGPSSEVTSSNVADLYDSVVTGNEPAPAGDKNVAKRQKDGVKPGSAQENQGNQAKNQKKAKKAHAESKGEKRANKDQQSGPKHKHKEQLSVNTPKSEPSTSSKSEAVSVVKPRVPPGPAPPKLTPLQASMRDKLISARFRHLNETLYTRPSAEAYQLFDESPEMFEEYHEGFRRQVKVWPENPVDSFLGDIRTRAKNKPPHKGRHGPSQPVPSQLVKTALPRTAGTCVIADLGCGDARLAESLQGELAKLRLDVRSYDLQSPSPLVTKADIANLPLEDGSVNVVIFCLALMGTNWVDFVEEAFRILHWKGELWIAEIKSRFAPAGRSKNAPVSHSVGNRKKLAAKKGKGRNEEDEMVDGDELAVEVDGNEDRRRETDVSAFVEVLKSRGFVLQGQPGEAVDLSNRMFVKMHFIKGASPTKGKGVKAQDHPKNKKPSKSWPDGTEDDDDKSPVNEASILKPCVYKIR